MIRPARVVVAGAGIAGLAAALRLLDASGRSGRPLELIVCEAAARPGGTIASEQADGYLVESGPDAFLTEKPPGLDLCRRLGLSDRLGGTNPDRRRVYVVRAGRLLLMPEGFYLLAPAGIGRVLWSPLFSWPGKARMALDLVLPPRTSGGDESLASFVRRRLGREVLDRVAQPLVAGIYTADPETLSLAATMPRFLEMEREAGSVIRGLSRRAARRSRENGSVPMAGEAPGARLGLFAAPADGMGAIVDAAVARLPRGALRLGTAMTAVVPAPGGPEEVAPDRAAAVSGQPAGRYRVALSDGSAVTADGVILAMPAHATARLLSGVDPSLAAAAGGIPYASSVVVTLGYRRDAVAHPLDGSGFVVPRVERRPILACTFSSEKFPGRAPQGHALLRVFLGGVHDPGAAGRDEEALVRTAAGELRALLGVTAGPHLVRVHRHERAMPQYLVGHLDRVAALEAAAGRHAGLALAGAAYRGVGVPDCIASGEAAADRVLADLGLAVPAPPGAEREA